jgi:hypothetical protein
MNRALAVLIGACSAMLFAPLLYPLATGRIFVFNDLTWFHLPTRYLYQQALSAGDTVLWTPSIFAGFYLHGEGQVGLFHPLHQLLYRLLPLGPAFNLELIANYVALFGGTVWFLRRLAFDTPPALFGAMLFTFSGFNLLHHHHVNLVAIVAHMPWLLGSADVLIVEDRRRVRVLALAGMAAIFASELLTGFPQGVWWNALALAGFATFRAHETGRWRRLPACVAAVTLGTLLGGIQLLPTADAVAHSMRFAASSEFALTFSTHPFNLVQWWSPYFFADGAYAAGERMVFHEFGLYSGAILPVSLIWVWIRRPALDDRRRLITAVTAFAAMALLLALGRYGGVARLLMHVPILSSLRAPGRYIVLTQFALAILAAVTLEDLLAIASRRRAPPSGRVVALWIPLALGCATTMVLNSHLLPYGSHSFADASTAGTGVAVVAAVSAMVYLAGRRTRWAIPALIVFTAVDLAGWGLRFVYREPPRTISELVAGIPPAPHGPAQAYAAVRDRGFFSSDLLVLGGYRLTSGYVGLFPATVHPLDSDVALQLSGTRWLFTSDGSRRPYAGSVDRVRLLDSQGRQSTGGSAILSLDRPGHLIADVIAPGPGTLALTERFHDGWTASVDGAAVPAIRVEGDFLGCDLRGGAHRVTFRFMPRSFVYGLIVSGIGLALLATAVLVRLR